MKLGIGRLPLLPRLRDGPLWPQRRYLGTAAAAASVAQEIPNKRRTRKRMPAHERKAMVEAYVDKYRVMNAGKFPTTTNVVGQIGGCYYKTKLIIQELEYNSKLSTVATAVDKLPISQKAPLDRISDAKAIIDCKLENTMACETLFATLMDDSELPGKPSHPCEVSDISRSKKPEEVDENSGHAFESDEVTRVTCIEEFSTLIDTKKQVSNPDSANVAKLDTTMMRNEENKTPEVEKTLDCQVRVGRTATVDLYQVSAEDDLKEVDYHNCQRMMDTPILMKGKEVAVEDVRRSEETTVIGAKATTTEDCDIFVMPSHHVEAPKTLQNTMISNDEASAPDSKCDNIPSYGFGWVCKHFLDAVEKKQYGWFWVCPNGGKNCHYRHALPPGYVLKSQMKALLEEEADKMPIEEEIEEQRAKVKSTTPMTTELFAQWKQKKIDEKAASMASQSAERAKNDRMSGRELFLSNASLFVDDVGAWDQYEREESENNEAQANEKAGKEDHGNSAHGDTGAPSSSGAANDDDDDSLGDIDDDLDEDELEELEASLSRTSIQIKEPGPSA